MLNTIAKTAIKFLPDLLYHQLKYSRVLKKWPNLIHPTTFSEKITLRNLWLKMIYTELADKHKVRKYIAATIGEEYLIKQYCRCDELTEDIFASLPSSFVIKANHGSGFNQVVYDKSAITFAELSATTRFWTKSSFYKMSREKHYKNIKPCLLVEELLLVDGHVPNDIKFHCFNRQGEMNIFIQIDYDRFGAHRRDVFDENWQRTDIRMGLQNSPVPMAKPKHLSLMTSLAKRIAKDFSYLRIDFYEANDKIYFGELTFTPGGGLCRIYPEEIQHKWGSFFID